MFPYRIASLAGLLLTVSCGLAASHSVGNHRCEYRTNPVGVDTSAPRLSWVIESKERGVLQSAYQVLVASSADALKRGEGNLWDSGKVESDASAQVPYAGRSLASGQTCHWKVRVWNQAGEVSDWSPPATWTMGLLQSGDWRAQWIGFTPPADSRSAMERLLVLDGCSWVWANGSVSGDQPQGRVYFRKQIELPAGTTVREAKFLLAADDTLQLFANGKPVQGSHRTWRQPAVRDLTQALKPGANLLAIEAENTGNNPAGLIGKLVVVFENAETMTVAIDRSWFSSRVPDAKWKELLTTGDWKPAAEIVRHGDEPWGRIERQSAQPAPFFRKAFAVNKPIQRAVAFASALGAYELHLNGKPVSTDVLSPGWTDFHKRVHYLGYDVTEQIKRGDNVVGAILGDGWYASYLAFTGRRHFYGGAPRLLVQLNIEYQDGTREVIGTDDSWLAAEGPIREADLHMGCVYDAREEFAGWNKPGFNAAKWRPAQVDAGVKANLVAHPGEPMRRTEEIIAKKITEPSPGVYVFDLGQNLVGWARVKLKGKPGQRVVLRHAEMLNSDGTIYTTNLRAATQTDTFYLANGGKRAYEPYFTFHGFQYVEVTGLDYKPEASDLVGVVVHSDLPRAGWFECSEPLVNKLTLNSIWGQRGNFLDVPTDCPQRDERAGWTGDAQVFMKTACLNLDSPAFYTKWLRDLCADSQREDGGFGDVAPHFGMVSFGNTGWSDAGPICAWRMFEMYGDARVLAEHYSALQRHMEFLAKTSKNFTRGTGSYGDWLRLSGPQHSEAIGTAYYNYTAQVMANIAEALGKAEDAAKYRALAADIRAAFVKNYIKPDGRIVDAKNETGQTFYALAFGLDLVPAEMKGKVAEQFVASLAKEKDHIATGFLGTPFILFALQKAGHPELAYKLVLNKTYPGWLQQVLWGSTTMWERWDGWRPEKGFQDPGMNSFNHYWLGCVSEWLFTQAAGIDTEGPGFRRIVIRPELVEPERGFSWVKAKYDSIRGSIESRWKLEGGRFQLEAVIPANSTATIYVPASNQTDVTEGGKPVATAKSVKFLREENGKCVFEVGSGTYRFASKLSR